MKLVNMTNLKFVDESLKGSSPVSDNRIIISIFADEKKKVFL